MSPTSIPQDAGWVCSATNQNQAHMGIVANRGRNPGIGNQHRLRISPTRPASSFRFPSKLWGSSQPTHPVPITKGLGTSTGHVQPPSFEEKKQGEGVSGVLSQDVPSPGVPRSSGGDIRAHPQPRASPQPKTATLRARPSTPGLPCSDSVCSRLHLLFAPSVPPPPKTLPCSPSGSALPWKPGAGAALRPRPPPAPHTTRRAWAF